MRRSPARRADEFAAALEGRLGAPSDAVAPMLAVARQLQSLPLGPPADFRDALRARLVAVATVSPATVSVPEVPIAQRMRAWAEGWRVQRGLAAASAGMVAVISITGVATAGSRSLPGDPLYGVKTGAEGVQLAFARTDVSRGERYLQHAETRLDEVQKIVGTDAAIAFAASVENPTAAGLVLSASRSKRVAKALAAMDEATQKGTKLLTTAYLRTGRTSTLQAVARFARRQQTQLVSVLPAIPDPATPRAEESLELVERVAERADALLDICSVDCAPLPTPPPSESPSPSVAPSPSPSDSPSPTPCECESPTPTPEPSDEPSPSPQPSDEPSPTPEPEPSPSGTDSASPEPSHSPSDPLPTLAPGPINTSVDVLRRLPKPSGVSFPLDN